MYYNYELHHRKLNRMRTYNYSQNGVYFVTICTKYHEKFFGVINNHQMILNEYGKIVWKQWLWTEDRYRYIFLDQFIVMPDHVHGILIINNCRAHPCRDNPFVNNPCGGNINLSVDNSRRDRSRFCRDRSRPVPTMELITTNKIKPLPELIGAFKTISSKIIHQHGFADFAWQRSFYDRIIRDKNELNGIQ